MTSGDIEKLLSLMDTTQHLQQLEVLELGKLKSKQTLTTLLGSNYISKIPFYESESPLGVNLKILSLHSMLYSLFRYLICFVCV